MRAIVFWSVGVLVFAVGNGLIAHKEYVLRDGETMLLRLAPVDPRSLLQGDYMVLRYDISRRVRAIDGEVPVNGKLVVTLDRNGVARFVRIHEGEKLAEHERLLRYRKRREVRLGAESFFFQEGHAKHYENARYGELKVNASGNSVLVGLRGGRLERLGPE